MSISSDTTICRIGLTKHAYGYLDPGRGRNAEREVRGERGEERRAEHLEA